MSELGFTPEDEAQVLSRLKDFQRQTVDYVFGRLYAREAPAKRFLVADEVGLGKTMVARGVVAKTILELDRRGVDRIDIIYVCSNLAIARQNINRLNVLGTSDVALSSRLTLLPKTLKSLEQNRINFVALTPGTSFDLKSNFGRASERVLIGKMLFEMLDELGISKIRLMNLLQATVKDPGGWRRRFDYEFEYNEKLAEDFREAIRGEPDLIEEIRKVAPARAGVEKSYRERRRSYEVIGRLRRLLARVCVHALEPDLVILDEFQRFRNLLSDDSDMAELARDMMTYEDVRTLLLSATPYKMLTLRHGDDEDDHHRDFLQTLEFLFGEGCADDIEGVRLMLGERRRSLYAAEHVGAKPGALRDKLHEVMVRTERVDFTRNLDAMLVDRDTPTELEVKDLEQAAFIDEVSGLVEARDPIEYWKSAPYLLNFMKNYRIKQKFEDALEAGDARLIEILDEGHANLLHGNDVEKWHRTEPQNARLRKLEADTVKTGLWRLLWMPPAMPYEEPEGSWAEHQGVTKTLVFSAWTVVPDAVSVLLSYEAERQMTAAEHGVPYSEISKVRGQLLNFAVTRGRPSGMPSLALVYPSPALAAAFDPLEIAAREPTPADAHTMRRAAMGAVVRLVDNGRIFERAGEPKKPGVMRRNFGGSAVDESWYWASLARMEDSSQVGHWVRKKWRHVTGDESDDGLRAHIDKFVEALDDQFELGALPDQKEVEETLAAFALGSPAICAMRSLKRISPELEWHDETLMSASAQIAWGFRTLFNLAETTVMLRGQAEEGRAYWRIVLDYCRAGNLQAVLDEYVHVLLEQLGLMDSPPEKRVLEISRAIADALSIRTASLSFDEYEVDGGEVNVEKRRVRTRFALRYGDLKGDDASTLNRSSTVRAAFNSPFRPFVLISTSVGQEGLDFHTYCHRVWHWNLPHNPVDLEQREGRVHRYKGHAIRRALAGRYGLAAIAEAEEIGDPWAVLFRKAIESEDGHALHPFWLYETEGGPKIERCVPLLPMSRDGRRLHELKRSLAVYRLAFGQARQDDLLAYLEQRFDSEDGFDRERIGLSLRPPTPSIGEKG